MLSKKYIIQPDAPPPMSFDDYYSKSMAEFHDLLGNHTNPERVYQSFFERNPSFVPGAFQIFGKSGHYPHLGTLISQPVIGAEIKRKPDFMWLAKDSLSFCPVLIEIERPQKLQYRQDRIPNALFNQACDQITEWKALLSTPQGIQSFYDRFGIPDELRKRKFKPQYVLIYGRRSEYDNNEWLRSKRAEKQTDDFCIMSFDRLMPSRDAYDFVTSKVSNGIYYVVHIPPTYVYRPATANTLPYLECFCDCINRMEYVSKERRDFLTLRYDYWRNFGMLTNSGLINTGDKE